MAEPIPSKTLTDLEWPQVCEHLARRCHTDRGHAAARALGFLATVEEARARSAAIGEARTLREVDESLPFGGIQTIDEPLQRVAKGGALAAGELLAIAHTVAGCSRLKKHIAPRRHEYKELARLTAAIEVLDHVSAPILDSFAEGEHLVDHASSELGPLRRRAAALHEQLIRRSKSLLDDPVIAPHLQDKFYTQREERYVIPMRADSRGNIRGIVHGMSASGQTLFIEPEEIIDLNNRLKMAASDVAEEERRILAALSGYVREEAADIAGSVEAATGLDLIDGAARLAADLDASAPALGGDDGLLLVQARHPLIVLGGRPCVANDLAVGASRTLVLSGPNAGGKTVALKTAGLAALMARAGLHVAAGAGSRLPWYRCVWTDVGDDQSLEKDLSTFSAHLHHLCEFLAGADRDTLVLIDEVAVGTEPDQGAALAQAVLEALADRGASAVVTTHYERLKGLAPRDERFVNGSVGFDLERMAPTFRVELGVPGSSGALMVARRLGLPAAIADRAEALLGDRSAGIEALLVELTEERRRLAEARAGIAHDRQAATMALGEAEAARSSAKERERELRRGAHSDAVVALRRARDELDRVRVTIRKAAAPADLAAAREQTSALAQEVGRLAPAPAAASEGTAAPLASLVPGVAVVVPHLNGRGRVVAAPERGRVTVQIGNLRTTAAVSEVRLDTSPPPRAERRAAAAAAASAPAPRGRAAAPAYHGMVEHVDDKAPARTSDATLDLRGARVDEALTAVDRFLDESLLASRDIVFVIHGHGTGVLRTAVREHLERSPAVQKWRPGQPNEGGDGVTIAWLDQS